MTPALARTTLLRQGVQLGFYSSTRRLAYHQLRTMSSATGQPKVLGRNPLSDSDAKWIGLSAIEWVDPTGKQRKWESADRKTRKGEVDAVAILTLVRRPSSEPHVLLVSQFRPPVGHTIVELPAGLVDAGEEGDEGAARAALRELHEETGYGTSEGGADVRVQHTSMIMYNDPGLTGANMKLCVVDINVADDAPDPVARPDEGEFIERHLVPAKDLQAQLEGLCKQGYAIDARLAHIAAGVQLAGRL